MKFLDAAERILLTAWTGGMWAIGYIAAPTLFSLLDDRKMAGQLAGQMFHIINWIGLICGILLLITVFKRYGRNWQLWILLVMVLLVANSEFILQPMMTELKAQGLLEGSEAKARFGMLHGISSILYLLTSTMGLVLVAVGFYKKPSQG